MKIFRTKPKELVGAILESDLLLITTLNLNQLQYLRFSENSLNLFYWKNSVVLYWLRFSEFSLNLRDSHWFKFRVYVEISKSFSPHSNRSRGKGYEGLEKARYASSDRAFANRAGRIPFRSRSQARHFWKLFFLISQRFQKDNTILFFYFSKRKSYQKTFHHGYIDDLFTWNSTSFSRSSFPPKISFSLYPCPLLGFVTRFPQLRHHPS